MPCEPPPTPYTPRDDSRSHSQSGAPTSASPHQRGHTSATTPTQAIFLFLWWVPAALVLTFFSPYLTTSNAYFATWVAVIMSCNHLAESFERVGSVYRSAQSTASTDLSAVFGLSIASFVVAFASIEPASLNIHWEAVYGITVGIMSGVISLLLYFLCKRKKAGPAFRRGAL